MGRTNPTFRDTLQALEDRWGDFRRALRRRDQHRFDRLYEYAREHADASGYANPAHPMLAVFLSIDLEQETRLDEAEERVDDLEEIVDTLSQSMRDSSNG